MAPADLGDGTDGLTAFEQSAAAGRRDGRASRELRGLKIEQDLLERCDGSARLSSGGTVVLAAVYGPMECPVRSQEVDQASVSVTVRGGVGHTLNSARWMERFIRGAVETSMLMEMHPRTSINIVVHILEEDGSVLAACTNAVSIALVDAAVPMRSVVCAISVGIDSIGTLILDPTQSEQAETLVHGTFCFESVRTGLVSSKLWGFFEDDGSYFETLGVAEQAAEKVQAFLRIAATRKAEHHRPF
mmetsp:Transcript_11753/g.35829  ORF Transcript_11753/g.35829 Transcript_11753/m.35829 type:complete len:245 (-) Transcript_11753:79-813(-)|eukprot:CAMPEP_0198735392 /NCGR_PEP_ID=MMETSP1475-20131203/59097_1 /TAXON_ID= ORGANISM="Unidentified sp., Strain CCMP1999" /NCGR_SAMPLE_ID=MMETSP1475 /ASSEMBLY_ACC=CAM_ASM_001111 /LENGTH=244 /DNA_ID=CAMNT_0044499047 /DNA_START=87 /DNA_END=821 /DNA_ORIENTATION=-